MGSPAPLLLLWMGRWAQVAAWRCIVTQAWPSPSSTRTSSCRPQHYSSWVWGTNMRCPAGFEWERQPRAGNIFPSLNLRCFVFSWEVTAYLLHLSAAENTSNCLLTAQVEHSLPGYTAHGWSAAFNQLRTQRGAHPAAEPTIVSHPILLQRIKTFALQELPPEPPTVASTGVPQRTRSPPVNVQAPVDLSSTQKDVCCRTEEPTCVSLKGADAESPRTPSPSASPPSLSGIHSPQFARLPLMSAPGRARSRTWTNPQQR